MTSFRDFPDVYDDLGLTDAVLGCIMLDTEPLPNFEIPPDALHYDPDPNKHRNGKVGGQTPHITLLYGLMPGVKKWHVDSVLEDWWVDEVELGELEVFELDDCNCIVIRVNVDPLLEAHQRLSLLPHVNTFFDYKAHLTLAYVKKEATQMALDCVSYDLYDRKAIKTTKINYGNSIGG